MRTTRISFHFVSANLRFLRFFINDKKTLIALSTNSLLRNMSSTTNKKDQEEGSPVRDISTTATSNDSSILKDPSNSSKGKDNDTESDTAKCSTRKNRRSEQREHVAKDRDTFLSMDIGSKRKLYKCKSKYHTLDMIDTWPQFFSANLKDDQKQEKWWKINSKKVEAEINDDLNSKMSLFRGDITSLEIDAIANAANESLLGGGGVDGAIHSAAGPKLRSECELLNGCQAGEAKITCGYKLPAKYVVHTVGPRGERPDLLKSCYVQSLNLLKEHKLKSIAFPCISTGIFGYPNLNAAHVALSTIRDWLEKEDYAKEVDRIIMCLFLQVDVDVYNSLMQLYFPLDRTVATTSNDNHCSESEGKENVEAEEKENVKEEGKGSVEGKENVKEEGKGSEKGKENVKEEGKGSVEGKENLKAEGRENVKEEGKGSEKGKENVKEEGKGSVEGKENLKAEGRENVKEEGKGSEKGKENVKEEGKGSVEGKENLKAEGRENVKEEGKGSEKGKENVKEKVESHENEEDKENAQYSPSAHSEEDRK